MGHEMTKPLRVKSKIQETANSCSLVFEIPSHLKKDFVYTSGQFITLFLNIDGEILPRSYSLSSSPVTDTDFKITVQRVQAGKGSNFILNKVQVDDILQVSPPAGRFFVMPKDLTPRHYLLFAAGSGITPLISILKSVLEINPQNQVTLINSNRDESSVIFMEELNLLEKKFPSRLKVVHVLSRPSPQWPGPHGRLNSERIIEITKDLIPQKNSLDCYLCGPIDYMSSIKDVLIGQGLNATQIHSENFYLPQESTASADVPEGLLIGDALEKSESPEKILVRLEGAETEIQYSGSDTVLEAVMNAGLNPPYSCLSGNCMACMAKITRGTVIQADPGILTDDNVSAREALTCQAKPLTKIVKVDYDQL